MRSDLPAVREGEARDLIYARSSIVVAAAAAHVQAVDGVWVDLKRQPPVCSASPNQSRQLGFTGMSCIHPSQIGRHQHDFQSDGGGRSTTAKKFCRPSKKPTPAATAPSRFGGQLIDRPIVERARRTIDMAKSLGMIQIKLAATPSRKFR